MSRIGYIPYAGIIWMMKGNEMRDEKSSQSVLREYVRRVMNETGLSAREIARQSNRTNAIKMSDGYITKIIDGPEYNPTIRTLRALASGMGRPETEVLDAARGMHPDWENKKKRITERVWDVYTSLPESQQALFLAMVESFADWTANLDSIIEGEPQYWNVPTEEADTSPQ